jgi:hypothetical protein
VITYILVLVLNGIPTNVPVQLPTESACAQAGEAWKKESKKLRGMSQGDYVCVKVGA